MMTRNCKTCRWWNAHSNDLLKGDCMVPNGHRYSRVPVTTVDHRGKTWHSMACLDSFSYGKEETRPNFTCGAWASGEPATA